MPNSDQNRFNRWLRKTIHHLSYATSSHVYHFIAISEFKLKLQSENAQVGSKSVIFLSCGTLKFDRWPRKTMHLFKICASFHSGVWIQTRLTVRKRPNWGKICFDLCDPSLLTSDLDLLHGHHFVNGNKIKFHDDIMTGTLWKGCNKQTDGLMDRQTDGKKCS